MHLALRVGRLQVDETEVVKVPLAFGFDAHAGLGAIAIEVSNVGCEGIEEPLGADLWRQRILRTSGPQLFQEGPDDGVR